MKKVLRGLSVCIALVSIVWSLNSSASVAFEFEGKFDATLLTISKNLNESCPEIYQPVCGQPIMPVCPPGQFCTMQMPSPKTYSNMCELKRSNAVLLFKSECESFERAERISTLPIALRLNERKI